jgi:hypothetical protein
MKSAQLSDVDMSPTGALVRWREPEPRLSRACSKVCSAAEAANAAGE